VRPRLFTGPRLGLVAVALSALVGALWR
jgi:hypothetical protein